MCNRGKTCLFCGIVAAATCWFVSSALTNGRSDRDMLSGTGADFGSRRSGVDPVAIEVKDESALSINGAIVHHLNARDHVWQDGKYVPPGHTPIWPPNPPTVFLPEGATVGEPSGSAGRTDHWQLARWFADTYERQQKGSVPVVKYGEPFNIFSGLFEGGEYFPGGSSVKVKSLHVHGRRLILKLDFSTGVHYSRGHDMWFPLVEVPVSRRLTPGTYLLDVDWGDDTDWENAAQRLNNDLLALRKALYKTRQDGVCFHHAIFFVIAEK